MKKFRYRIITFLEANDQLKEIIGFNIDIFHRIDHVKNFKHICTIKNYEDCNDIEIFNKINKDLYLKNKIYIYTEDYSINYQLFFKVASHDIETFIKQFHQKFKVPFFTDKTIFICPETKKFLLYFQEGWWFYYDLPLSGGKI